MGDQWEAQIGAIENIQKKFECNIQEMDEQLAKLTNLFEDHIQTEIVRLRGPSPLPNQQVPRPFVKTTSHLPCEAHRPNLRQPMPTLDATTMAGIQVIPQKIASHSNIRSKI